MRLINILGGIVFGVTLSQFPEYSQQYAQRLGGAIDELAAITRNFDATAARQGLDRETAFERYAASEDGFLVEQGRDARAVFARYDKLLAHQTALNEAGPVERVTSFASYFDPAIASRTFENYQPAVPVTALGAAFTGVGFVSGYGLMAALAWPFRRRRRVRTA